MKGTNKESGGQNGFTASLLDTIPLFFMLIDDGFRVRMMNRCMLEALGWSAEEAEGQDYFTGFVPEKDRGKVRSAFESTFHEQRNVYLENRVLSKEGGEIPVEWRGVSLPFYESGSRLILCVGVDLRQREESKAALRESEEKYRQLFEMESDAIFLIDNETGRILEVNPSAEALYGYSREELLQMDHTQVSAEPGDTRKATMESRSRVPIRYHKRKDGTVFPVEITARHFRWQGRQSHIAAIRDISFRMKAEEEKRLFETQLRQAQKMEAIGTLAGGIAHDFNNILGGIGGYTELAMMGIAQDSPVRDDLNQVLAAVERAKELVNQILEFSRGKELKFRPLQMGLMVKESLKMLRAGLPATIEIRREILIAPGKDFTLADPTQIHQLLMNLCTNAAHAMEEKGGTLRVTLSETDLNADGPPHHPDLRAGPYLEMRVEDSGTGIDPATLTRIFDPYFTTKEKGKGSGLGLAIVDGIVRKHGGAILVESEPGEGSVFRVFLPRLQKKQRSPVDQEEGIIPTGHGKILFVDDEPFLVEVGTRILESLGYEVIARTSAIEAIELCRKRIADFDLVITDQTMPHVTGFDLAQEIKRLRPAVPIVLCTGFSELISVENARAIGIHTVLKKPISKDQLAKAVRKALDGTE
ncbi:MAG: PAS domain S-box protein [Deltaproteobacteria bacterium]|nr:PAS domain S-box protein [Deltaproteobacteria bacterium]